MRFSIRTLLGLTACAAVAFWVMLKADRVLTMVAFTATALVLLYSVVAAIRSQNAQRAYWIGFAVFGWGYFLLFLFIGRSRGSLLITNTLLENLVELLIRSRELRAPMRALGIRTISPSNILPVGNCVFTLVLATFGGFVAKHLPLKQNAQTAGLPEEPYKSPEKERREAFKPSDRLGVTGAVLYAAGTLALVLLVDPTAPVYQWANIAREIGGIILLVWCVISLARKLSQASGVPEEFSS